MRAGKLGSPDQASFKDKKVFELSFQGSDINGRGLGGAASQLLRCALMKKYFFDTFRVLALLSIKGV